MTKILVDTGPLLATVDNGEAAHKMAERHQLPIPTFDFADFRATESSAGPWRLVIDEHAYRQAVER